MASKLIYSTVAIVGIVAASTAAWWMQSKNSTLKEIPDGASATATPSNSSANSGSGPGAGSSPVGGGSTNAPRAVAVEVAKVEKTSIRDDAQAVGTLRSRQSVMLRPEVAGRVVQLGFADGSRVRKGQMLVQLDDTLQRAEIKQSQAQVAIARSNHKRNQDLVAQNFVAKRVLEESDSALQVAEAQLSLSCARADRMRLLAPFDGTVGIRNVNIGDYVKDGADLIDLEDIGMLYVDFRLPERFQNKIKQGQSVELQLDSFPGRKFTAKISALDPLIDANGRSVGVRATMPNTAGVAATPAPVSGSAGTGGNAPVAKQSSMAKSVNSALSPPSAKGINTGSKNVANRAGSVAAVSAPTCPIAALAAKPSTNSANGSAAKLSSPTAPSAAPVPIGPLRPGMFARVTAVFATKNNALIIPEEAIVPQAGRQFVIKVIEPGLLAPAVRASAAVQWPVNTQAVSQKVEVKLGVRRPGKVEVVDGLLDGDVVVVAGQQRLQRDGMAVRTVDVGRPSAAPQGTGQGGAGVPSSQPTGQALPTNPPVASKPVMQSASAAAR